MSMLSTSQGDWYCFQILYKPTDPKSDEASIDYWKDHQALVVWQLWFYSFHQLRDRSSEPPSSLSKINEHILGWGFFKNPSSSNKAPPFIGKMLKRVSLAAQDRRANTTLWLNLWSKRPHMPKAGNTSAEQLITKQYSPIVSKPELWNPSWPQNKFTKEFITHFLWNE